MNLPNKLSVLRILLVPVMIFFYMADSIIPFGKLIALGIFIIAALTDMLDGYLARKNNQVTNLGKLIDPIADKILAMSILLLLVMDGTILAPYGIIAAIIIIGRDFMVDALRQLSASKNYILAADKWGKWKTIIFDIAFPLLVLYSYLNGVLMLEGGAVYVLMVVSYSLFAIGTVLCVFSGINYMVKNKGAFKD